MLFIKYFFGKKVRLSASESKNLQPAQDFFRGVEKEKYGEIEAYLRGMRQRNGERSLAGCAVFCAK